jgi:hypothetical protein
VFSDRPGTARAPGERGSGGLSRTRRGAALAVICIVLLGCASASSANAATTSGLHSVLLVFANAGEADLARTGSGLSVGMMSASQGRFQVDQFLLDLTQGARVASSAYSDSTIPALGLQPSGAGAYVEGWQAARRRALSAPQTLTPGLLAGQLPGGPAYAGIAGSGYPDAPTAAGQSGRIASISLGSASTLLRRIAELDNRHRLVVADLASGPAGLAELSLLSHRRPTGELLIVVQRVINEREGSLLWVGVGGLPVGGVGELTSQTTQQRGLIASVDIAPTILTWLGDTSLPSEMRGKPIEASGALHSASLRALMARLRVVGGRRLKALGILLAAWALMLLLCSPWPRGRARAMRAGGLGVLWSPVAVLITAALEPGAVVEYATIALLCLVLGVLSDLLVPWPRAPIVPAAAVLLALTSDALAHTQLLMRSLLGPNPILGARFYGIGNELKSVLAVMVLAAVAGALHPGARERRAVAVTVIAGLVLAIIEGSARIGAGVGGVILVSVGFAVAVILLAPGALTRKRALILLLTPIAALVVLALIDLATAHGGGHFTGSVLHARSPGDVRDIIVRRYKAAWGELHNHAMPVATGLSLICAWLAVRRRTALLAPVGGDPLWLAALGGGLSAGVIGALVEDSGPVLLVVAVFALGCVLSYLWGGPAVLEGITPRSPDTSREGRSRARKPSAAPAR